MMAKPKVGDYYWFTGAYDSHIAGKALVVRKVIKGYECMVELVTKDGMFGWENPIRCDVRRLFGTDEYETYKDWLEKVEDNLPILPTVKKTVQPSGSKDLNTCYALQKQNKHS